MGYFGIPGVNDHTKGIDFKKAIPIDKFLEGRDSTPKELVDLRSQFFAQKGLKKTVSIPFEGGTFYAKPNTSIINQSDEPIISFYPDNTEYNVANAKNFQDLEALQQIYTTVGGIGAALASARPQTQNIVIPRGAGKYEQGVQIPVSPQGMSQAAALSKYLNKGTKPNYNSIVNQVQGLSRFKRLKEWTGVYDPNVYLSPKEVAELGLNQPFQTTTGGSGDSVDPVDSIQSRSMMQRAIDNNLTQGGRATRLNYKALLNNKTFRQEYVRLIAGDVSTPPEKGLPISRRTQNINRKQAWENLRNERLAQYEEFYGPAMRQLDIDSSQIDLDHKLTLVQSLGMLHNTNPKDPLWLRIQNVALRRGYVAGDAEQNLDLVDPETHRVKTNFFNHLHGLNTHNNMKYWNGQHRDLVDENGKPISRFQIMDNSHKSPEAADLHIQVVEDYFDKVDRGTKILNDAQLIWKANNLTGILPEQITEELFKVVIDSDVQYTTSSLKAALEGIMDTEIDKYKQVSRVLEIELELSKLDMLTSKETILPDDAEHVKKLKKELIKLKTVRKSKWFKNYLRELEKDYNSGQTGLDLNDYEAIIDTILGP